MLETKSVHSIERIRWTRRGICSDLRAAVDYRIWRTAVAEEGVGNYEGVTRIRSIAMLGPVIRSFDPDHLH